jgi:peptidoglycan hydrolase-like protein with peptidoglycan-binding domain
MTLRIKRYSPQSFGDGFAIDDDRRGRDQTKLVIAAAHEQGLLLGLGHDGFYGPSVARALEPFRQMLGLSLPLTLNDLIRIRAWFDDEIAKLPRR